ncbi:MAG: hypothetical protein V1904_13070 [Bacteroidota bacterium]
METFNNTPQNNLPKQGGFNMNIIFKICGALAVIFLMFLPVAGCERTNEYNVNGLDIFKGVFKSGEIDASTVLFFLSLSCGIAIIFFRKALLFMIFGTSGIVTFLSAYIYVKSKNGMDVVELKIGAFLAIMSFIAIIVLGIIKMAAGNKSVSAPLVQQPQITPQPQYNQQSQNIYHPSVQQQPPPRPKFCTKCGNKFPENYQGKFCTSCGVRVLDV